MVIRATGATGNDNGGSNNIHRGADHCGEASLYVRRHTWGTLEVVDKRRGIAPGAVARAALEVGTPTLPPAFLPKGYGPLHDNTTVHRRFSSEHAELPHDQSRKTAPTPCPNAPARHGAELIDISHGHQNSIREFNGTGIAIRGEYLDHSYGEFAGRKKE